MFFSQSDVHQADLKAFGPLLPHVAETRGKTFIVVGANTGIGLDIVRFLAIEGQADRIVLACRSTEKAAAAIEAITSYHAKYYSASRSDNPSSEMKTLAKLESKTVDFLDLQSVRKFAQDWATDAEKRADKGKVDTLFVNAGAVFPHDQDSKDGLEATYSVNTVAQLLFDVCMLPFVSLSSQPRIVHTSSQAATFFAKEANFDFAQPRSPFLSASPSFWLKNWLMQKGSSFYYYGMSKTLLDCAIATEFQNRLLTHVRPEYRKVIVCSAHPGFVASDIATKDHYQLSALLSKLVRKGTGLLAISTANGAANVLIAAMDTPNLSTPSTYYTNGKVAKHNVAAQNKEFCKSALDRCCKDAGIDSL